MVKNNIKEYVGDITTDDIVNYEFVRLPEAVNGNLYFDNLNFMFNISMDKK